MPNRGVSRRAFGALAMGLLAACGRPANDGTAAPGAAAAPPDGTLAPERAAPAVGPAAAAVEPAATAPPDVPLAPELDGGGTWINSEPLTLAALRGSVVLVNFWTFGCINCRNTLPSVRGWWERHRDQGLVIVGVHTPEFQHEHDLEALREATVRLGVAWPVVQDNEKAIWRAYRNRYWPRFYLVGRGGAIVYDHIGEGAYEETERRIAAALER